MAVTSPGLGRVIQRDDITLRSRTTETGAATYTYASVEEGDKAAAWLFVVVYAAPGGTSPTLIVVIEGSDDNVTFFELGRIGSDGFKLGANIGTALGNITAAGTYMGMFPIPRFIRAKAIIGGSASPSFDFSVTGNAS